MSLNRSSKEQPTRKLARKHGAKEGGRDEWETSSEWETSRQKYSNNLHFDTNSVMLLSPGNLARRRNIPDLLIRNASKAAEAKEIGYSMLE